MANLTNTIFKLFLFVFLASTLGHGRILRKRDSKENAVAEAEAQFNKAIEAASSSILDEAQSKFGLVTNGVHNGLGAAKEKFESIKNDGRQKLEDAENAVKGVVIRVEQEAKEKLDQIKNALSEAENALKNQVDKIKSAINKLTNGRILKKRGVLDTASGAIQGASSSMLDKFGSVADLAGISDVKEYGEKKLAEAQNAVKELIERVENEAKEKFNATKNKFLEVEDAMKNKVGEIKSAIEKVKQAVKDEVHEKIEMAKKELEKIESEMKERALAMKRQVDEMVQKIKDAAKDHMLDALKYGFSKLWQTVKDKTGDAIDSAKDKVSQVVG
jgi:phage-related protein